MANRVQILCMTLMLWQAPAFAAEDPQVDSAPPAEHEDDTARAEPPEESAGVWASSQEAFHAGWLKGKLESALSFNEHLGSSSITVDIRGATAVLHGAVSSDDHRDLAGNIASGLDGIETVDNRLTVDPSLVDSMSQTSDAHDQQGRDFSQYVKDLSTTAAIKASLLAHEHVNGMSIKVSTYRGQVTLSGEAESQVQKELAEYVAKKRENITDIENRIAIVGP